VVAVEINEMNRVVIDSAKDPEVQQIHTGGGGMKASFTTQREAEIE
jgi:hypothetical protein